MEEFIKMRGKILKIENPIAMFSSILAATGEAQKSERWQTLNTLMVINNHRRIDHLEEQVALEQARVRFLEDFSGQLGGKVRKLEKSMDMVKKEVSKQKRSLITIMALVKLISNHHSEQRNNNKLVSMLKSGAVSVLQNAAVFGIVQMIMKITWLDTLIDSLTELLKLSDIFSKKSVERSRFLVKLSISITLFFLLKEKIKSLLLKLKQAITFLG